VASEPCWHDVGTCTDDYDEPIAVGVLGGKVTLVFGTPSGGHRSMHLDAAHREDFQRLFMEAERQAEAHCPPAPENEYGCVRCQAYHRESDGPIYAEHILWQSKHGIRRAAHAAIRETHT